MHYANTSPEETRSEFNRSKAVIKLATGRVRPIGGLGIDLHQEFCVVVEQVEGSNPKPAQRFKKEVFLRWAARLKQEASEVHAVYEACGFGFGLQFRKFGKNQINDGPEGPCFRRMPVRLGLH